jgi:hypothetical protein
MAAMRMGLLVVAAGTNLLLLLFLAIVAFAAWHADVGRNEAIGWTLQLSSGVVAALLNVVFCIILSERTIPPPLRAIPVAGSAAACIVLIAGPMRIGMLEMAMLVSPLLIGAVAVALVCAHAPPAGQCSCGYDLRGNASGICPECGQMIAAASST